MRASECPMSNNANCGSKSDGSICPTCGEKLKNNYGMRIHHATVHNESLSKTTVGCDNCGTKIERYKHKVKRHDNTYCTSECEQEEKTGKKRPDITKKITVECDTCGEETQKVPSQISATGSTYCSRECYQQTVSERQTGENNPNWNPDLDERECEICGVAFVPHHTNQKGKFCSKKCKGEWQSGIVGEDHWNWGGGGYHYYGPNWKKQKENARKRDEYTCQACGYEPETGIGDLQVHHIQKLTFFKERYDEPEWWKRANKLTNLVTLCKSCHKEWEGIPLKPELQD